MQGSYLEDLPGSAKLSPQAGQAKLDISMVAALIKVWYLGCSIVHISGSTIPVMQLSERCIRGLLSMHATHQYAPWEAVV